MATKVNGLIQKVNPGNTTEYSIASTAYGYCETAAATAAKVVDMTGFTLLEGTTIHVKFKNNNTAASPTLNVNGTGAKPIVQYGTTAASTSDATTGWYAGAIVSFTYDGTSWVRDQGFNTDTNTTYPNAIQVYNRTSIGTSPNFDNPGVNGLFEIRNSTETTGESGTKPFNGYGAFFSAKTPDNVAMLQLAGNSSNGWYIRGKQSANVTLSGVTWDRLVTNSGTWAISITGNASTATKFASNQSVTLTGDVTGSASSQAGWSIATTLANSGVTANTYGDTSQQTPSHGGTFNIPYFTVDVKGRITQAGTTTVKLPTDNNTDTKVTQSASTTANWRKVLLHHKEDSSSTTAITEQTDIVYGAVNIAAQPSTGTLRANIYNIADQVSLVFNTTTNALDFVFA